MGLPTTGSASSTSSFRTHQGSAHAADDARMKRCHRERCRGGSRTARRTRQRRVLALTTTRFDLTMMTSRRRSSVIGRRSIFEGWLSVFRKKCPNCARLVRDGALFCLDCGVPLNGSGRHKETSAHHNSAIDVKASILMLEGGSSLGAEAAGDGGNGDGEPTKEHDVERVKKALSSIGEDLEVLESGAVSNPEKLVVRVGRGSETGKELVITGCGLLFIGRSAESDLVLSHGTVSRRHAAISLTGQGWVIKDLNSTNGTYLNGKEIAEALLKPGDVVEIGDSELLIEEGRGKPCAGR